MFTPNDKSVTQHPTPKVQETPWGGVERFYEPEDQDISCKIMSFMIYYRKATSMKSQRYGGSLNKTRTMTTSVDKPVWIGDISPDPAPRRRVTGN